jgi:hypothetical protein
VFPLIGLNQGSQNVELIEFGRTLFGVPQGFYSAKRRFVIVFIPNWFNFQIPSAELEKRSEVNVWFELIDVIHSLLPITPLDIFWYLKTNLVRCHGR